VRPRIDRRPSPDDEVARRPEIVLGFSYWAQAFGGDSSVIGQTLLLNGRPHTIVGIAPRQFFGITVGAEPDFYAPIGSGLGNASWVRVVARLRPGISRGRASAALMPVFNQIIAASGVPPVERKQDMARLLITPAGHGFSEVRNSFGASAWSLTAGVALMLLGFSRIEGAALSSPGFRLGRRRP
jgi:hypothetical protein